MPAAGKGLDFTSPINSVQFSQFNSVQLFILKTPLQQEACILRYRERPRCYKPYEFSSLRQLFMSSTPLQREAWILQTLSIQFSSVQSVQFSSVVHFKERERSRWYKRYQFSSVRQLFISSTPLQREACIWPDMTR